MRGWMVKCKGLAFNLTYWVKLYITHFKAHFAIYGCRNAKILNCLSIKLWANLKGYWILHSKIDTIETAWAKVGVFWIYEFYPWTI